MKCALLYYEIHYMLGVIHRKHLCLTQLIFYHITFLLDFFSVHWKHILVTFALLYWEALLCDLQCHRQDQILPKSTGWAA